MKIFCSTKGDGHLKNAVVSTSIEFNRETDPKKLKPGTIPNQ